MTEMKNKNHAKEIAEMLGLEIGEKFKIEGHPDMGTFWFVDDDTWGMKDLWDYDIGPELYEQFENANELLEQLLTGFYEVKKLPWKPKLSDRYCYFRYAYGASELRILHEQWYGNFNDLTAWHSGNCFRTEEEALAKVEELREKLRKGFDEA